jgi:CASP C terminal
MNVATECFEACCEACALGERVSIPCRGTTRRAANLSAAEAGRVVEDKYTKEYEKKLDPFAEFKGKVSERSKAHMPVADRIMYTIGELMFGSKLARLAVVVYIGLMHLLTFSVLSSVSHARHDSMNSHDFHCSRSAVAAALQAEVPSLTDAAAVL